MVAKTSTSSPGDRGSRRLGGGTAGARPVTESAGKQRTSLTTFFQESRSELRRVTWPTRQDALNLTVAVIAMTAAIAVFLGVIDGVLDQLVKVILGS